MEGTAIPIGAGDPQFGHGYTITARDLLQVLQENDRLLSTLLERLTMAGAAQPQTAATFRSSQITSWEGFEVRFRRTFVSQTRVAERWRRMQEHVQQRNVSATDYLPWCQGAPENCTMPLGRTHDDDDDLLHDILEFERIEREWRKVFGSRTRSLASSPGSERSLRMTREMSIDRDQGTDRRHGWPPVSQHELPLWLLPFLLLI
ncbi:hypothetical protein HPB52_006034 [Rhipicephalus sanguineus]|uniref:Uncharacterized protein n=1 Tax=Rhipicephalus sanguineus TaxID=34632 RepID=A0A9D4QL90_RHISA|nr:hypothetical protein HPB52_006034 [Rhipicephalus sanguineus]